MANHSACGKRRKKSLEKSRPKIIMQDTFLEAILIPMVSSPGRKNDEQLKEDIISNIEKNLGSHPEVNVSVSVFDATVTLSGKVKTYEDRALAGQTVWNTPGVVKGT